jgi:hypothetical protein
VNRASTGIQNAKIDISVLAGRYFHQKESRLLQLIHLIKNVIAIELRKARRELARC